MRGQILSCDCECDCDCECECEYPSKALACFTSAPWWGTTASNVRIHRPFLICTTRDCPTTEQPLHLPSTAQPTSLPRSRAPFVTLITEPRPRQYLRHKSWVSCGQASRQHFAPIFCVARTTPFLFCISLPFPCCARLAYHDATCVRSSRLNGLGIAVSVAFMDPSVAPAPGNIGLVPGAIIHFLAPSIPWPRPLRLHPRAIMLAP